MRPQSTHGVVVSVPVPAPHTVQQQRAAGRRAAAEALRRSGSRVTSVPRRRDGAPVFPAGLAGSITHAPRTAVAVVVPGAGGVGVDLETGTQRPEAARVLLSAREREALWADRDPRTLRWLQAAKEAAFKALRDEHVAHGGLYWRIALEHRDGRWIASAGGRQALVTGRHGDDWAFALARTIDPVDPDSGGGN